MKRPFKLIVFDWDGTLIDSQAQIVCSLQHAVQLAGVDAISDDEAKNVIGLGLIEAISQLLPGQSEACIRETAQHYREHYLTTNEITSSPFEGVETLLQALQQSGYWLAVATGKGRNGLNHALQTTGFNDYFIESRCADETFSKPHPQMLLDILDSTGVSPDEAVMVGDTEFDMEMASNAGVAAIAVSYGVHEKSRLMAHGPLACLDDIRELPQVLTHTNH